MFMVETIVELQIYLKRDFNSATCRVDRRQLNIWPKWIRVSPGSKRKYRGDSFHTSFFELSSMYGKDVGRACLKDEVRVSWLTD